MAKNVSSRSVSNSEQARKGLEAKKLTLIYKVNALKLEIAKVNLDLHRAGADSILIACW